MYFPPFIIHLTLKNCYDISLTFLGEMLIFFSWYDPTDSPKQLEASQFNLFSDL